jgi:hypothetical protein
MNPQPVQAVTESLDGRGAGDRDVPFTSAVDREPSHRIRSRRASTPACWCCAVGSPPGSLAATTSAPPRGAPRTSTCQSQYPGDDCSAW